MLLKCDIQIGPFLREDKSEVLMFQRDYASETQHIKGP